MKISKKIKSVLKIIVCLSLSFALMSALTLSVFAVTSGGGGTTQGVDQGNYYYSSFSSSEFNGSNWVYNNCSKFAYTDYAISNGCQSIGYTNDNILFEITSVSRDSNGNITSFSVNILTDFYFVHTTDYETAGALRYVYKLNKRLYSGSFETIYSSINNSRLGYKIDWSAFVIPEDMFSAGEQFTYHNYFGKEQTVTFNGKGGIFGGVTSNRFNDLPEGEFPDISDYIPDITDEKYKINDLVEYLPEMPDSLDILDWIKYLASLFPSIFSWLWDNLSGIVTYLIDLIKGFIAFVSDFFKSFFENLKNVLFSLFDTSEVDISGRIDEVKEYVFIKFPILSTLSGLYSDIETMLLSFERTAPVITFPTSKVFGGEDVTVSLEFLRPVTAVTDVIIIAACYLLTLIYSIRAIPNIIGGIGSGSAELANSFKSSPVSDHDNQSRFGRFKDFEM